jgi:hypothetical protein
MATLTFPSIVPNAISFGIKYSTQINISPLSGSVQTYEVPGARWVADLSYSELEPVDARELISFLTQLRGSSGRFTLFDFSHRNPAGSNLKPSNIFVNITLVPEIESGTALGVFDPSWFEDTSQLFITDDIVHVGDYIKDEVTGELR